MSAILPLSAATPPDLELVASTGDAPVGSFQADAAAAAAGDLADWQDSTPEEESSPGGVSSLYEQNAVEVLLGLHCSWPSTNSSHDEDSRDEEPAATGNEGGGDGGRWGERSASWPLLSGIGYTSPGDASPKAFRCIDYETPGPPSPKRMRPPKDGAPPPGTSRFRCRFPGCKKLYASTDAVRKHCRKRHLDWLRRIDMVSAHERGLPKPALYCVWGEDEEDL